MGQEGEGVLLYLNQEGRHRAGQQDARLCPAKSGLVGWPEANHRLGFNDDERDFRIGAGILRRMGFGAVRLMTNNPRKVAMLEGHGIRVAERVPLITPRNRHNTGYLM